MKDIPTAHFDKDHFMNPHNAPEEPITHGGTKRGYKQCKCSKCGIVSQCTPNFDFYTTTDPNGPLLCERCFWQYAHTKLKEQ